MFKKSKNKFSIIIPCYNKESYICECLSSILAQTLSDFEVLCIDDASTDNTAARINEVQKCDPRISLLVNPKNCGAGYTRNVGLDSASGEFICFMDADDLYPETNTLETLYNASRKYAMHTVGGNLARFYHDDRKILDTRTGLLFTGIGIMNYMEYNSYPTWGFQRFAFSRALMKKYHVRFPGISRYEDPLFFVRYMNIAKAFAFIDDIVYLYRITREFTIDAMALEAMIASTAEILDILVHISFDLYYKEYSIFISHIFTYLEQRKNSNLPEEAHIGQNIDHVLQKIDFSQYDAYIYSAKIYTSFFDILQEHAL